MPKLQYLQTVNGPRPLVKPNAAFAFDPKCCCFRSSCGQPSLEHDPDNTCENDAGFFFGHDSIGCVDLRFAPPDVLDDLCKWHAYLDGIELDIILPDGFSGTACVGKSCVCSDLDGEVLASHLYYSTFALGNIRWGQNGTSDGFGEGGPDYWCAYPPSPDGVCIGRFWDIFLECYDPEPGPPTTPKKDWRCRWRITMSWSDAGLISGFWSQEWRADTDGGLSNKVILEAVDEHVPLYSETIGPFPLCIGSMPTIHIKTHGT